MNDRVRAIVEKIRQLSQEERRELLAILAVEFADEWRKRSY
jgi:hypothetical protein